MSKDRKSRILVVEDNEDNRQLLRIYMTREGYEVTVAADGQEALEVALAQSLDLIISDVQMPRMDGYSLCQRLKQDPRTERIPLILITSVHTTLEDTLEGLRRGANDFISRPFRQSELLARARTQLRIKELQDRLIQAERAATIGRMAVTLAHEINNPLTGILGYVEVLLHEMKRGQVYADRLELSLQRIQEDALRVRDVLRKLREIPTPETYEYAPGLEGIVLEEDGDE
ncbi:MAG: response regulator [Chloroflexia bacterium]|nr:response regulator [Chloroflexia bacterium]